MTVSDLFAAFIQLFAAFILMIIACVLLGMMLVYAVRLPIDEGQEFGALATAGILRGMV